MPSEKELLARIERLEKQVSDLSLALGGFAVGTYNGYLMSYEGENNSALWPVVNRMKVAKQHHTDGGRVELVVRLVRVDDTSFSVKFDVIPNEDYPMPGKGPKTAWEHIAEQPNE